MNYVTHSDVWQGTSGTSRDVPAVGLESLSGLKMCCEQILKKREKRDSRCLRAEDRVFTLKKPLSAAFSAVLSAP